MSGWFFSTQSAIRLPRSVMNFSEASRTLMYSSFVVGKPGRLKFSSSSRKKSIFPSGVTRSWRWKNSTNCLNVQKSLKKSA